MLAGRKFKGHPDFGVVNLPPKDWPCNCINTPDPGAASTAASTSPIRTENKTKQKHTQNKNTIYMSSIF